MTIEHEFEYDAGWQELADEFTVHDSEYQADFLNRIGHQFKIWLQDKTRTATYIQIMEIAEMLDDKGRWFIDTLHDYMNGG